MALSKHQEEIGPTQTPLPSVFVQVSPIRAEFGLQKMSSRTCRRKLTGWFEDLRGKFLRLVADRLRVEENALFISFPGELKIVGMCTVSGWERVNFLHSSSYHAVVWFFKGTFHPLPLPHPLSQKQRITELYVMAILPA